MTRGSSHRINVFDSDLNSPLTSQAIKEAAQDLGFDLTGIAPAVPPVGFDVLRDWLARNFDGEMGYIKKREEAYGDPRHVMGGVKSVILTALNYRTAEPQPIEPGQARVSRYAWGDADYHDVIKSRLKQLADWMHDRKPNCRTRAVVDTAPLLERDFARLAGLGWFGKNTMLINKRLGSWFFLGALLVDVELEYDAPHDTSHCGTCTRCLEACPTDAFPEPYVLDARRCISYLTIELRGPTPLELRDGIGEWLFGCDICQDVCPWNNKAPIACESTFEPATNLDPANILEILALDEEAFRERFRATPLWRPKRSGMVRNAAIVAGNTRCADAVPLLTELLRDPDDVIRDAARWAIEQITRE